jgi:small subunit ribosomal protein S17
MADEDVKGTSADAGSSAEAEVPGEDESVTEPTQAEEPAGESTEVPDEAVVEPPAAEAEDAPAETEAEDAPAETEAEDAPAETEASSPEAEVGDEESGSSAEGEVPAKRKRKRLPRALRPKKTRPKPVRSTERKPIARLEKPLHDRGRRQERQGTVVSDAMEKTIVVEVAVVKAHPRYKKVVRRTVKFHAHDERSEAKVGDVVRIVETRPLSKTKRWRLVEVLEAAK